MRLIFLLALFLFHQNVYEAVNGFSFPSSQHDFTRVGKTSSTSKIRRIATFQKKLTFTGTRLYQNIIDAEIIDGPDGNDKNDDDDDDAPNEESSAWSPSGYSPTKSNPSSDLPTTDSETGPTQLANPPKKNRWKRLYLTGRGKVEDEMADMDGKETASDASLFMSTTQKQTTDFVYLLEPPENRDPSVIILFLGGAILGQFPQVAYNQFLTQVSDKLNALVLSAPYSIGLNHFDLAKRAGEAMRRAIVEQLPRYYSLNDRNLTAYCMGHSLGAKLNTIYMAAMGHEQFDGVLHLAYNNFGFSQTIGMATEFARQMEGTPTRRKQQDTQFSSSSQLSQDDIDGEGQFTSSFNNDGYSTNNNNNRMNAQDGLGQMMDIAQSAMGMLGVEFSPNPRDMERLIDLKYTPELQAKTRFFSFDDDSLDCTADFYSTLQTNTATAAALGGTHLTPVYVKLGLDDFASSLSDDERLAASDAIGGYQSAAFGDETALNELVDQVCAFIQNPKEPPRREPDFVQRIVDATPLPPNE